MDRASSKGMDEGSLTKGQLRKLTALRKSVGDEIGERTFATWLASQGTVDRKEDGNAATIIDTLWPLVEDAVPEIVPDHLHRRAPVEEMLGRGVTQRVRSPACGLNARLVHVASDHGPWGSSTQRLNRCREREEQCPFRTPGADLDKVPNDGLPDGLGEREEIGPPGLGAAHAQRFVFPVQVVEL